MAKKDEQIDLVNGPVERALEMAQLLQAKVSNLTPKQPDPLTETLHDQGVFWKDLRNRS